MISWRLLICVAADGSWTFKNEEVDVAFVVCEELPSVLCFFWLISLGMMKDGSDGRMG